MLGEIFFVTNPRGLSAHQFQVGLERSILDLEGGRRPKNLREIKYGSRTGATAIEGLYSYNVPSLIHELTKQHLFCHRLTFNKVIMVSRAKGKRHV